MSAAEELSSELLRAIRDGGGAVAGRMFERLYDELHRLAGKVRQGRGSETMSTTALVHEAYIKLASADAVDVQTRLHFYRVAARAMRQILVDAARRQLADKRGGDMFPITLNEALHAAPLPATTFLALDDAIDRLSALDPRAAQVVECRYFAGLTVEETAATLGISARTVKRDWRIARSHLIAELDGGPSG